MTKPDGSVRLNDIPLTITKSGRGYTDVLVQRPTLNIGIRLSEAERISLIEGLGGKDAR